MRYLYALAFVATGVIVSCEDSDPNYPIEPHIALDDIMFGVSPDIMELDSITFTITFRDGDGDLGLAHSNSEGSSNYVAHASDPYHPLNHFLAENGGLIPVTTYTAFTDESPPRYFSPVLKLTGAQTGKLVTDRTRNEPGYSNLPQNTFPDRCFYYTNQDYLYIVGDDSRVIDDTYNIVDTLNEFSPPVYVVSESFYTELNPNFYNIIIDYLVKQPDGSFEKFNWETAYENMGCLSSFYGRFPMIGNYKIGNSNEAIIRAPFIINQKSKYEGSISYSMKSNGFLMLFQNKTLKLRISIKDRALHTSNIIETEEFTLESIRR